VVQFSSIWEVRGWPLFPASPRIPLVGRGVRLWGPCRPWSIPPSGLRL